MYGNVATEIAINTFWQTMQNLNQNMLHIFICYIYQNIHINFFFFAKTAGQGQGQVSIYSSSLGINNSQQKTCLINSKKDAVICVLLGIHTAAVIIFI